MRLTTYGKPVMGSFFRRVKDSFVNIAKPTSTSKRKKNSFPLDEFRFWIWEGLDSLGSKFWDCDFFVGHF